MNESKPFKWEVYECLFCGWILKFQEGRTDVSTYCDKCHDFMEKK